MRLKRRRQFRPSTWTVWSFGGFRRVTVSVLAFNLIPLLCCQHWTLIKHQNSIAPIEAGRFANFVKQIRQTPQTVKTDGQQNEELVHHWSPLSIYYWPVLHSLGWALDLTRAWVKLTLLTRQAQFMTSRGKVHVSYIHMLWAAFFSPIATSVFSSEYIFNAHLAALVVFLVAIVAI